MLGFGSFIRALFGTAADSIPDPGPGRSFQRSRRRVAMDKRDARKARNRARAKR